MKRIVVQKNCQLQQVHVSITKNKEQHSHQIDDSQWFKTKK
ncbi:hypothetical protein N9Y06_02270 [Flavobacteriales bacterium]|nr:hypothetical protein [Flavobacteriales bacterium]